MIAVSARDLRCHTASVPCQAAATFGPAEIIPNAEHRLGRGASYARASSPATTTDASGVERWPSPSTTSNHKRLVVVTKPPTSGRCAAPAMPHYTAGDSNPYPPPDPFGDFTRDRAHARRRARGEIGPIRAG
jgi:hypothetical protein